MTKEEILSNLKKVSDTWENACNISFDYQGDKLTDYVDGENTITGNAGLVKWGNLPGNAVGRSHQGTGQNYAKGFVLMLMLKPSYFDINPTYLYSTILHETGHVIGLPHSNKSIMYWQQSQRKQILNDADKTMCKYFRSRWQGMNKKEAADKYNLLINESYTNEAIENDTNN